jgi:hypothetical protein
MDANIYYLSKSPKFVPILSQITPINAIPTDLFMICSIIILPFKLRFSKWSLFLNFFHQNRKCTSSLPHTRHTHHLSYYLLSDNPDIFW